MSLENPVFGSREDLDLAAKAKSEAVGPESSSKPLEMSSVEPEKPDLKFKADVKIESPSEIKVEHVRPERVSFEKRSLEEITQNGSERIEAAKQKFSNLKTSVLGRFSSVFGRVKGAGKSILETAMTAVKTAPKLIASLPELGSYAIEAGKAKVQESYHSVADTVQGEIAKTKFQFSKGYETVIDKSKDIFEGIEMRGVDALIGYNNKIAEIVRRTGENLEVYKNTSEGVRQMEKEKAVRDLMARAAELGLKVVET